MEPEHQFFVYFLILSRCLISVCVQLNSEENLAGDEKRNQGNYPLERISRNYSKAAGAAKHLRLQEKQTTSIVKEHPSIQHWHAT